MHTTPKFADNQSIAISIDETDWSIEWYFADGSPKMRLELDTVSAVNQKRAAAKGLAQQRVVDGAAVTRKAPDGTIRTDAEMMRLKREKMARIIAHIGNPQETSWELPRVGGGARGPSESDVLEAIKRATGVDGETMLARWIAKEKCERADALKALCGAASVRKALLEIAAERVRPAADADAALAALVAGSGE